MLRGVWRVLLMLALGSLVATVVAAPVVLGGGLALQGLANRSRALPSEVTAVRLPQRSVLTDVTGRMLVELHGPEDRVVVPLQAIAPVMQQVMPLTESPQRCSSKFPTSGGAEVSRLGPVLVGRRGR